MSINKFLVALGLTTSIIVASVGCAATSEHRSTGQVVDDAVITTKVKAALIDNKATKARQIDVDVHAGVVQLNGFVDSSLSKTEATKVAIGINGVKSVRNNLEVAVDKQTVGEVIDDGVITAKVKTALVGDSRTKAVQIEVATNEGVVQLGGFVDNANAKSAAGEVAMTVAGVRSVHNNLRVKG